jgi:hypothetical protein
LKNSLKYLGFLLCFVAVSCSTERKLQKLSESKRDLRANELIKVVQNRNNGIERINAKASCDLIQKGKKTAFNITLKTKTDTAIWISISPALGIEVARAMLTPDSMIFMDKLNKTYFVSTYTELSEKLGSELDFNDLQDLLLYKIIKHQKKDKYISTESDNHYELLKSINRKVKRNLGLKGQNKKDLNLDSINTTLEFDTTKKSTNRKMEKEVQILIKTIINKKNLAIESQSIKDVETDKELNMVYGSDYFTKGTYVYPQTVDIDVKDKGKVHSTFSLTFSRFRINEDASFTIRVPSKYEKVEQ